MKKFIGICLSLALILGITVNAGATPSTQIWIPSTDVQAYKTFHLGMDNYSTVFRQTQDDGPKAFATDYGLTVGALPFEKLQMEAGIDLFEPTKQPVQFNAKLGVPEKAFGEYFPAIAVGGCNFGTATDNRDPSTNTNYNMVYGVVAKTLPVIGRLSAGYYVGNDKLLLDARGNRANHGVLLSWDRQMPEISDKLWLAVDHQGGNNLLGATSVGGSWNFASNVSVIVGYVFFNDTRITGKNMLTTQLDINF